MKMVDAYVAWCPNRLTFAKDRRRGDVIVGTREEVVRQIDRGYPGGRMPFWNPVADADEWSKAANNDQRTALTFIMFSVLVVREKLDPQRVHEAFLAIEEYSTISADPKCVISKVGDEVAKAWWWKRSA